MSENYKDLLERLHADCSDSRFTEAAAAIESLWDRNAKLESALRALVDPCLWLDYQTAWTAACKLLD